MKKAHILNQGGVLRSIFRISLCFIFLLLSYQAAIAQKVFSTNSDGSWSDTGIWLVDGNSNAGFELPGASDTVEIYHEVAFDASAPDSVAVLRLKHLSGGTTAPTVLRIDNGWTLNVVDSLVLRSNDLSANDSIFLNVLGDVNVSGTFLIEEESYNQSSLHVAVTGNLTVAQDFTYDYGTKQNDLGEEVVVSGSGKLNINGNMNLYGQANTTPIDIIARGSGMVTVKGDIYTEGGILDEFILGFYDNAELVLSGSILLGNVVESPFCKVGFYNNSTITFDGDATQHIFGRLNSFPSDSVSFQNVTITNTNTPAINVDYGEVWIKGDVDWQGGFIWAETSPTEGATAYVVFDTSATITTYSNEQYIEGYAGAFNVQDITLPLGSNGRFGQIRLFGSSSNHDSTLVEVRYVADESLDESGTFNPPTGVEQFSKNEYWSVYDRKQVAKPTVELFIDDASYSGIDDLATLTVLQTTANNGGLLDLMQGSVTASTITTSFQLFPDAANPLEITYGSTDATKNLFGVLFPMAIDSLSTYQASVGGTVTVYGDELAGTGHVTINQILGNINGADGSKFDFTLPAGAPYAPVTYIEEGRQRSSYNPLLSNFNIAPGAALDGATFDNKTILATIQNVSTVDGQVRIGDLDNNDLPDIAYTDPSVDSVTVLWQDPEGVYTKSQYSFGSAFSPNFIELVDLNNDNFLDMVVTHASLGEVALFFNDESGDFIDADGNTGMPSTVFTSGNTTIDLHVGQLFDVDYPTIGVMGSNNTIDFITYVDTSAAYVVAATVGTGEGVGDIVFGDFDNDGVPEVVQNSPGLSAVAVYTVNLAERTVTQDNTSTSISATGNKVRVVDYNLDGNLDLAVSGATNAESVTFYKYQSGTKDFAEIATHSVPSGKAVEDFHFENLNGSSGPELIIITDDGSNTDQEIVIFEHDGSGYANVYTTVASGVKIPHGIESQDLTGDGLPDLVVHGDSAAGIVLYTNSLPLPAPATQPTDLEFDVSTLDEITLHFTPADDAQNYLVLRRLSAATATGPADGTSYTVGGDLAGQTVISTGPENIVTDTSVDRGIEYAYDIFAYNNSGSNILYNGASPLNGFVSAGIDTLTADSTALVALFNNLDGQNWVDSSNWLQHPVQTWHGVTVEGNRVTRIDLSGNNLSGSMPTEVGDFVALEYLNLSDNALSGSISEAVGALETLDTLILRNNFLTGFLPDSVVKMDELAVLDLGNNRLDDVPTDWFSSNVVEVYLDSNYLDFAAIEDASNAPSVSVLTYTGQDHPEANGDTLVFADSSFFAGGILRAGINDVYTWYQDGDTSQSLYNENLDFPNITPEEAGSYVLEVTNSVFTADTLYYGPFNVAVSTYRSDSVYLTALYDSLGGASWTAASSWKNTDMYLWEGVVATDTGVVELDLSSKNVSGPLSSVGFVAYLHNLERLDLSENSLTGPIPFEWEYFGNLRALYLSGNELDFIYPRLDSIATLDTVFLDNNFLAFDDLAMVDIIGKFDSLVYAPQQDTVSLQLDTAETYLGSFSISAPYFADSLNVTYNFYKDSVLVQSDTLEYYDINPLTLGDAGEYYIEMTSTYAPDLTLKQGTLGLMVSTLEKDSAALTELFYALDSGQTWTDSSNWLTGDRYDLGTWFGVTANDTSVIEIDLSANNVEGTLPSDMSLEGLRKLNLSYNAIGGELSHSILDLDSLTDLDINNNFITGVPRLDSMVSLQTANLGYNLIPYPDIELIYGKIPTLLVGSMQLWTEKETRSATVGEYVSLEGYQDDGSANTTYQWLYNGDTLVGADSAKLVFNTVTVAENGYYVQQVANSVVPELIMSSDTIFLQVDNFYNDSLALVDIYNEFNAGSGWANTTGWLSGNLSTWYGVTLDESQVVGLDLKNNQMTGTLSYSVGNLFGLKSLDLSGNAITGEIPESILNLDSLTTLYLNDNEFNGAPHLDSALSLDDVRLQNNLLLFSDLDSLIGKFTSLDISSMKPWLEADTLEFEKGNFVNLVGYQDTDIINTQYQWFLNGDTLAGEDSSYFEIPTITVAQSGFYSMKATNTLVPGLTMETDSIWVKVSSLSSDSLALVDLFIELDSGLNWTIDSNWLSGPVSTWHGVTTDGYQVTDIDLSANNIEGTISWSIGDLAGLKTLNLANNAIGGEVPDNIIHLDSLTTLDINNNFITGLPRLDSMASLETAIVDYNLIPFPDLEPIVGNIATFNYGFMQFWKEKEVLDIAIGESIDLAGYPYDGSSNTSYQWLLNGDTLIGRDSSVYNIPSVSLANEGYYLLQATNSQVPGLTMTMDTIFVEVNNRALDSVSLVDFFLLTDSGANWTNKTNWLTGPLDTWHGVVVEGGVVTELNLPNNGMTGGVTYRLEDLYGLQKLDLGGNNLSGDIPPVFEGMINLTTLYLNDNEFTSVTRLDNNASLTDVRLQNNFLRFPALEPLVGQFTTLDIGSMNAWQPADTLDFNQGHTLFLQGYSDDSATTNYQWFVNGDTLQGADSANLEITSLSTDDTGFYYMQATNPGVPGLTMYTDSVLVNVSNLESDSLALVDIYNDLGAGAGWIDNSNWLTGNLDTWFGVSHDGSQVTHLSIPSNNVSGTLSPRIGDLAGLVGLDLGYNNIEGPFPQEVLKLDDLFILYIEHNQFTSLPRLDSMVALDLVRLGHNFFTFEELTPLVGQFTTFEIGGMNLWGQADTLSFIPGEQVSLQGYADGDSVNTAYQWFFNGDTIAGQTDAELTFDSLVATDEGIYTQRATNSNVPDVTMETNGVLILVDGISEDSLRLVTFYQELGRGSGWTDATNWLTGNLSTWYGVTIENGVVSRLELPNNGLSGSIPGALLEMRGLQVLDLSGNDLTGGLNRSTGWPNMTTVNLRNNQLEFVDSLVAGKLTSVDIRDNNLQFASIQRNLSVAGLQYDPQNQLKDEGDTVALAGEALNLGVTPQSLGGNNTITWTKNGNPFTTLVDTDLTFDTLRKADAGTYQATIENSLVPGFSLQTGLFNISVSTIAADSAALVALYDSTGGDNWIDNTNWLTGPVDSWYGVTVVDYSVTGVDLSSNGLTGELPNSVVKMSQLTSLNLSDNEIAGVVPNRWLQFPNLNDLNLAGNLFTAIPPLDQINGLVTLDVSENKLNFVEIAKISGFSGVGYDPQKPLTDPVDTLVDIGDSFQYTFAPGGGDAIQWYKDGVAISSQTNVTLNIASASFAHDGVYIGEVTSTMVPGLVLKTDSIFLAVSSLERDSAVLALLYQRTNGNNWTTQPNWQTADLANNEWDFVTVENNRVVSVSIPDNNLQGVVPNRIRDIKFLETLSLPDNNLFVIPDMSTMDNLVNLNVSGNRLQFGSLEPNVGIANFTYSGQKEFNQEGSTVVRQGTSSTRTIEVSGENNAYQWYLNGSPVTGATSNTLTIPSVEFEDMGQYQLQVTNSLVDDITLNSSNQRLLAFADVYAKVTSAQGAIEDGDIYMFRVQSRRYDSLGPKPLDVGGFIQFDSVILGNFVMIAVPNKDVYTDGLNTWYGDVLFWQQADTILLRNDSDTLTINLLGIPEPTDGDYSISGTVFEDVTDSTGRVERQRRVKGATVTVSRNISFGRTLQDEYEVVAITETDENGDFEFNFLPANVYRIDIQFPGVPMDSTSSIDISVGTSEADTAVTVTAVVLEEGITVEIEQVEGIFRSENLSLQMYPNPSDGQFVVQLEEHVFGSIDVQVLDITGKVKYQELDIWPQHRRFQMDLRELPPGMYLMQVRDTQRGRMSTVQVRIR